MSPADPGSHLKFRFATSQEAGLDLSDPEVLREKLGKQRILLNDDQRRRWAVKMLLVHCPESACS